MDREQRERRELKRAIKRAGNKRRRASLKQDLRKHPEEASHSEELLGRFQSQSFNGQDIDRTRRRRDGEK